MKTSDVFKVLLMLTGAAGVVALFLYARVDLGMSQEQINAELQETTDSMSDFAIAIWSQIALAVVVFIVYRIKRYRADVAHVEHDA